MTYVDGKAVPVQELITDKKGYALSPELPYGLYVVEESTVPENLKAIDPFLVKVDEDSREPMVWRVFDDHPFEFLLKIVKKDAQIGNPETLPVIRISIFIRALVANIRLGTLSASIMARMK